MEAVSSVKFSVASAHDVIGFYRVFLGRFPECEGVVLDRIGHDFPRLIEEFTSSSEFQTEVASPVLCGKVWRSDAYSAAPDGEILRWLVKHFGVDEVRVGGEPPISAWAAVLLQVMSSRLFVTSYQATDDTPLADLRTALRRLRLQHILSDDVSIIHDERLSSSISPEARVRALKDARNTYLLVRGRKMTCPVIAFRASALDVVEQVAAHLLSRDFAERVELALLATGKASGERFNTLLRPDFKRWVVKTLPLASTGKKAVMEAADHAAVMAALLADVEFGRALLAYIAEPMLGERLQKLSRLFDRVPRGMIASGLLSEEPIRQVCNGLRLVPLDRSVPLSVQSTFSARDALQADHDLFALSDSTYRVLGPDPCLILDGNMPPGRRAVSLELLFSDVRTQGPHSFQIFFDTGEGFTEGSSVRWPIDGDLGVMRALIIQDVDELRLRIDPCDDSACIVRVRDFDVAELQL